MIETIDAYDNAEATFKELRTQYDNVTPEFRKEVSSETESIDFTITEKYSEVLKEKPYLLDMPHTQIRKLYMVTCNIFDGLLKDIHDLRYETDLLDQEEFEHKVDSIEKSVKEIISKIEFYVGEDLAKYISENK